MYTSFNKYENEDEGITLYYKPSIPDPPNTSQVINSDEETETTEKLLEDYHESKIS